jgi:hypothetical protein
MDLARRIRHMHVVSEAYRKGSNLNKEPRSLEETLTLNKYLVSSILEAIRIDVNRMDAIPNDDDFQFEVYLQGRDI